MIVTTAWLAAQVPDSASPGGPQIENTAADPAIRDAALEHVLAERGEPRDFEKAVTAARRVGVNEQALLEARFLYHVDRRDDAAIAAMLPDFLKRIDSFNPADSAIFAFNEDWLASVEYVRAIHALRGNDKPAFKKHITEAFWLSPGQAAAFVPHIERMRLDDAMRDLKIDFSIQLEPLAAGAEAVTPAKLMDGKKALLIHFWSPWSPECKESMDDFATTATLLARHDIAVLSLVGASPAELRDEARVMIRPQLAKPCGTWAIDATSTPFSRTLRVRNLPTMALVSKDGGVLFNGDPFDPQLWKELRKISPDIKRPDSNDGADD
jgi:hypothetical protein